MPKLIAPLREIGSIRTALHQLVRSFDRLAVSLRAVEMGYRNPLRRKLQLTKKRRAALKLQGRYMGYVRPLNLVQGFRHVQGRATEVPS